jgi:hypothetical protein
LPFTQTWRGGSRHQPLGRIGVGAPVQLEHVVEVSWVDVELADVGGDLAVPQELSLGGGLQRSDRYQ